MYFVGFQVFRAVLADDTRMLLQQPRFGRCFQAGLGRWSVTGEVLLLPVPRYATQRFCFVILDRAPSWLLSWFITRDN